jgi:integrase
VYHQVPGWGVLADGLPFVWIRAGLMECIRLRVEALDFDHHAIVVRDGKGGKDRVVTLPDELMVALRRQLVHMKNMHVKDLSDGFGEVHVPYVLARKYPNAGRQWGW